MVDTLKKLKEQGFSKYRIAKLVGVSWNTVHLWYREVYKPNNRHLGELERILDEVSQ